MIFLAYLFSMLRFYRKPRKWYSEAQLQIDIYDSHYGGRAIIVRVRKTTRS